MNQNRKGLFYGRNQFLLSLFYCAYFYRLLQNIKPKIVVVSNDHNAPNRSLLYVSKYLNTKTAYLQHASVTKIFPPLEFDYAFLDGLAAHEAYKEAGTRKDEKYTKIFLSGCQKQINYDNSPNENDKESNEKVTIGLAINPLDDVNDIFHFCEQLSKFDSVNVILRNHPGQEVSPIKYRLKSLSNVKIEDSEKYSAKEFFNKIDMMIAGNTSMHLEASLSGIPCYYIEFGKCSPSRRDYYGYLRSGLIDHFPKLKDLNEEDFIKLALFDKLRKRHALKKYSNTFASDWQGKEGEIVALTLKEIVLNKSTSLFEQNIIDEKQRYELYDIIDRKEFKSLENLDLN